VKQRVSPNVLALVAVLIAGVAFAGCTLAPSAAEDDARARVAEIGAVIELEAARPPLPPADAGLAEHVRFAALNHPQVVAAYHEWHAAVADITPARALPDPKLTFEADIMDSLMTLMPGLMFDIMSPGKRSAMAAERTATSEVARRKFMTEVIRVAARVQREWIELAYATEAIRLHHAAIGAVEQQRAIADANYATGGMMASLTTQIELQDMIAEHIAEHDSASDRLTAARARFKSALGLLPTDPDPAWPDATLSVTPLPPEDELWRRTLAANPELARMRAMVEMTVAGVEAARRTGSPDYSLGLMADVKASPVMFRPTASVSLPVWREKIASTIAAAEARRDGAIAGVNAMQLELAAELAQMLYMVRESDRMFAYINDTALPTLERMAELAGAGYQSGADGAAMISEAALRTQLMQLKRIEILRQREVAATNLLLMTADVAPVEIAALMDADLSTR
jgi:cobalt-zinc-cadmium efflux system outer membrane protein